LPVNSAVFELRGWEHTGPLTKYTGKLFVSEE
jgi:hypothetical protein